MLQPQWYQGKNVLVTGISGFKGVWLGKLLTMFGANVTGYAQAPLTAAGQDFFVKSGVLENINYVEADIRDLAKLKQVFSETKPEVVFHLAAQPIVLEGYRDPVNTYSTNVMGTVNVLECVRQQPSVKSVVNVTTDKVYENREWLWGYRENDVLDGFDPYSNSKSCSELVTHSYQKSFLAAVNVAVSTARAGNVIGGGDFSPNRIIPDCIRAALNNEDIQVRNPYSTRPYQHVLEPLYAYLLIAQVQAQDINLAGAYNVGPDDCDCVTTGELTSLFCKLWGNGLKWLDVSTDGPHEANFLRLDCAKLKQTFNWQPRWHIETAVAKTIEWTKAYQAKADMAVVMEQQITNFIKNNSL